MSISTEVAVVAFFLLLAAVPALGASVALYGLLADPHELARHTAALRALLPEVVVAMLRQHLDLLANTSPRALTAGVIGSLLFAGWSVTRAMNTVTVAINIAYGESENRGLLQRTTTALLLAAGGVIFVAIGLTLITGIPHMLQQRSIAAGGYWAGVTAAWAALMALQLIALAALYRFAPDRAPARWSWTSPGALLATVLCVLAWAAVALLGTVFRQSTLSAMGGMVMVMTWAFVTVYAILLGAETNAEAERQTRQDTTVGSPRPIGERRAQAADTTAN